MVSWSIRLCLALLLVVPASVSRGTPIVPEKEQTNKEKFFPATVICNKTKTRCTMAVLTDQGVIMTPIPRKLVCDWRGA